MPKLSKKRYAAINRASLQLRSVNQSFCGGHIDTKQAEVSNSGDDENDIECLGFDDDEEINSNASSEDMENYIIDNEDLVSSILDDIREVFGSQFDDQVTRWKNILKFKNSKHATTHRFGESRTNKFLKRKRARNLKIVARKHSQNISRLFGRCV